MKKWLLTCSKDAVDIDFETTISSKTEPEFWDCYDIAMQHGCSFFTVDPAQIKSARVKSSVFFLLFLLT